MPRRTAARFVGRQKALAALRATLEIGTGKAVITQALLPRKASIRLLAQFVGPPGASDSKGLDELADQLGDLPLALTQAGA
ncbi:hypothetical protein ABZ297_16485 [Nonomuraea sp. NPDC005983]|uniref:hypothetical protein n=1 Tax=Nonomuraea sp. NPDC005983 TaxID=3155595 RepID=UPI0033B8F0EB